MTAAAVARRTKTKPAAAAAAPALAIPALKKGERYVGAIIGPDGRGAHVILLAGDMDRVTWSAAMERATAQGGDLPTRVEQALLFAHHKDQFKRDWYWSNTQTASDERWAWCQLFDYGSQTTDPKGSKLRARAVRRVTI